MDVYGLCIRAEGTAGYEAYCDNLIAMGVKWVRMSPEWGNIETAKGTYNAAFLARLDAIVNRLHSNGVQILWILCYTAPWASSQPSLGWPDITRHKPADWKDWEDYVSFIVSRYHGKISHWEVWNEADYEPFWKSSVSDYAEMLKRAYPRIKAIDPDNTVVMAGLALVDGINPGDSVGPGTFFDQMLELGTAPFFDVVNYHAYGSLSRHVSRYNGMMAVARKHAIEAKPIWVTETGFSTGDDPALEPMKADMMNQIYLGNQDWPRIQRSFIYNYQNFTGEADNGLVTPSFAPLPAYHHYQAAGGAAETNFALQSAYPNLIPNLHTLHHTSSPAGDGGQVFASGDDRVIPATRFMYFRVGDGWLYDGNQGLDDTVHVDVTYLDVGAGDFAVQYDSQSNPFQSIPHPRTGTGLWKTATFTLLEVKFANRVNGADLRIRAGTTDLTVRKVSVRKRDRVGAVVLTNVSLFKFMEYVTSTSTGSEAYNPTASRGGLECRSISGDGQYFYFRVSDALARAGDNAITVGLTFWDEGTDRLSLQYSSIGNLYRTVNITKTNTAAWRTVALTLANANFANSQNFSADFRVSDGGDGGAEYLRRVEVVVNATGYERWANRRGLTGASRSPLADPDLDQAPNQLEYAMGGEPAHADPALTTPRPLIVTTEGLHHLALAAPRNPFATDVLLSAEISSDLINWSGSPDHVAPSAIDSHSTLFRDTSPLPADGRRFLRLVATPAE